MGGYRKVKTLAEGGKHTRFDHSTDEEASARLGTHHLDSLLRANPLP